MLKKFSVLMLSMAAAALVACGDDSSSGPSASGTNEWREYCLDVINKYRATEDIAPLTLADESKQNCADKQSANDMASNKAHGHFKDCGEFAQNSGPNISLSWVGSDSAIVDTYLEMMWDEKKLIESGERDPNKDSDFSYIGHYLNMSRKSAKSVACGLAKSADGTKAWFNVNFY
ncbi:MAG: CAP domain-containing protein [Fibrobacter sp.]|nr:CAP domain-containing protein [Fibrobacter sp.]